MGCRVPFWNSCSPGLSPLSQHTPCPCPGTSASWHLHPRPGRSAFINICINLAVLNLQQGNIRGGAEWDDGPHCKQGQSLICWWQSIAPLVSLNTALYNVNPNNRIIVLSGHQLKITHYHINKSSFILTCHCSVSQLQSVEGCRSDVETRCWRQTCHRPDSAHSHIMSPSD